MSKERKQAQEYRAYPSPSPDIIQARQRPALLYHVFAGMQRPQPSPATVLYHAMMPSSIITFYPSSAYSLVEQHIQLEKNICANLSTKYPTEFELLLSAVSERPASPRRHLVGLWITKVTVHSNIEITKHTSNWFTIIVTVSIRTLFYFQCQLTLS